MESFIRLFFMQLQLQLQLQPAHCDKEFAEKAKIPCRSAERPYLTGFKKLSGISR